MNFKSARARIECPILVMAGERNPITPLEFSVEIATSFLAQCVRLEIFANCGHGVVGDAEDGAVRMIKEFVKRS